MSSLLVAVVRALRVKVRRRGVRVMFVQRDLWRADVTEREQYVQKTEARQDQRCQEYRNAAPRHVTDDYSVRRRVGYGMLYSQFGLTVASHQNERRE